MWKKYLIIIILFYLFALLQNSFFVHFALFGASPNLVFALFFLLLFFERGGIYKVIFLSAIAGIFLDLFSDYYLGVSVLLLSLLAFLFKKLLALLRNDEEGAQFVYYLPLFIIFLFAYNALFKLFIYFFDASKGLMFLSEETIPYLIYSSLVAALLFYVYKKFFAKKTDNRQLRLFNR